MHNCFYITELKDIRWYIHLHFPSLPNFEFNFLPLSIHSSVRYITHSFLAGYFLYIIQKQKRNIEADAFDDVCTVGHMEYHFLNHFYPILIFSQRAIHTILLLLSNPLCYYI